MKDKEVLNVARVHKASYEAVEARAHAEAAHKKSLLESKAAILVDEELQEQIDFLSEKFSLGDKQYIINMLYECIKVKTETARELLLSDDLKVQQVGWGVHSGVIVDLEKLLKAEKGLKVNTSGILANFFSSLAKNQPNLRSNEVSSSALDVSSIPELDSSVGGEVLGIPLEGEELSEIEEQHELGELYDSD